MATAISPSGRYTGSPAVRHLQTQRPAAHMSRSIMQARCVRAGECGGWYPYNRLRADAVNGHPQCSDGDGTRKTKPPGDYGNSFVEFPLTDEKTLFARRGMSLP